MGVSLQQMYTQVHGESPAKRLAILVADDLQKVNDLIHAKMQSPVGMIPDLATHLVDAGGKRLRPMITLATSKMLQVEGDNPIRLATAVEFIHSATLLHDDIVDGSKLRRGRPAANRLWGNSASVLVGDFLFARSFALMVETGHLPVLDILSRASSIIAEGEVRQLAAIGNLDLPKQEYLAIAEAKTAELFAAAASVSAVIANAGTKQQQALDQFGRSLGMAFQLVDDVLDYQGLNSKLGKQVGDDFFEGKITLPLSIAYHSGSQSERKWWEDILDADERSESDLEKAGQLIERHNGLQETMERAIAFSETAKESLSMFEPGPCRDCLLDLCDFVVKRGY